MASRLSIPRCLPFLSGIIASFPPGKPWWEDCRPREKGRPLPAAGLAAYARREAAGFARKTERNGVAIQISTKKYLFSMLALETREAVNSSIYSVLQRFAALLLNLAHEFGANHEPALLPFSNAELAEMLGVHVNSIANAITSLRRSGCIDKQRSYLAIIDFEKLRSVAENLVASE